MEKPASLEQRAAKVIARLVETWRGHGLSDEALAAAANQVLPKVIADYERAGSPDGVIFEGMCGHAMAWAIADAFPTPEPLAIPLCAGDFDAEVAARTAKLRGKLAPVRERYTRRFEIPATSFSAHALAVFDLFEERMSEADATLSALLLRDETARQVSPPLDGSCAYYLHSLDPPDKGSRNWSITLGFPDSDSTAHIGLDGWIILGLGWIH